MQIKPLTEEMTAARADIIAQLQRDILPLEGYKAIPGGMDTGIGLGAINAAFPNGQFPLGAEHEFICKGAEQKVSAGGFISGILAALMNGVVCPSGSLKCVRYFPCTGGIWDRAGKRHIY